ncbi:MAG: hypothetical protein HXX12_08370 [Geothrix sp.]|uniref:hypothetical protein n=1 Tax=Geothrix sp. TaxID=1962974 RepID=UPI00180BEFA7|nr:hypothetical protein [Geothrix sp.]NWJ40973.1 hypothetical protein [Geothrix sp.]WIL21031.1 MAG: hypothetical protein QOZ81_000275 [Geothrix sp.]
MNEFEWDDFENLILAKIVEGNDPLLGLLKDQINNIVNRERKTTGVGFFTKLEISMKSPIPSLLKGKDFVISDVIVQMNGLESGAGFNLFVTDGVLDTLEGYTFQESWPDILQIIKIDYRDSERKFTWA